MIQEFLNKNLNAEILKGYYQPITEFEENNSKTLKEWVETNLLNKD